MEEKKKQAGNSGIDLQTRLLLSLVWETWQNSISRYNKSIGLKGYENIYIGEDVEKLEPSYVADRNSKPRNHHGKQFDTSSQC